MYLCVLAWSGNPSARPDGMLRHALQALCVQECPELKISAGPAPRIVNGWMYCIWTTVSEDGVKSSSGPSVLRTRSEGVARRTLSVSWWLSEHLLPCIPVPAQACDRVWAAYNIRLRRHLSCRTLHVQPVSSSLIHHSSCDFS